MDNIKRTKNFTSSQMERLIGFESRPMTPEELKVHKEANPGIRKKNIAIDGFSASGKTYIEEVFYERISDRSISTDVKTVSMKWGSLMELVLFNLLEIIYEMVHKETLVHAKFKFWSGTPDLIARGSKIGEIKCFQPKNFIKLSLCLLKKDVQLFKKEFPSEYWQCVSNAIICGVPRAEIIAYMPYKDELEEIIEQVEESNFLESRGLEPTDYYFLTRDDIESMPYLPKTSKIENLNTFEFEIPQEDIDLLTERVTSAEKEVNKLMGEFNSLIKK